MKTRYLIHLAACLAALALASCGPAPASWADTPNPLNTPGDTALVDYYGGDIHFRMFASDYGH